MDKSEIKRIVNEIQTQKDVLKPEVRVEWLPFPPLVLHALTFSLSLRSVSLGTGQAAHSFKGQRGCHRRHASSKSHDPSLWRALTSSALWNLGNQSWFNCRAITPAHEQGSQRTCKGHSQEMEKRCGRG